MNTLYPATRPYAQGMLEVGDGNQVYWGPMATRTASLPSSCMTVLDRGCWPGQGRQFDPERYRLVLFDQRGCGRSRPYASDQATDIRHNTTKHLIADIELLRAHLHLGIDRWLRYGYSWGSTLSLAYPEQHPERVSEIVIGRLVRLGRRGAVR